MSTVLFDWVVTWKRPEGTELVGFFLFVVTQVAVWSRKP